MFDRANLRSIGLGSTIGKTSLNPLHNLIRRLLGLYVHVRGCDAVFSLGMESVLV